VIEATVFRTISRRPSSWEARLPAELLRLPEELARADALLDDDPAFFAPFAPRFHPGCRARFWAGLGGVSWPGR
jgi:transposase, IS5 family